MLLPEGLTSPYEVLKYDSTLILEDSKGMKATVERTQQIRFLQNGVSGILDHVWGDGVVLTFYDNEAGRLEDSFEDQGRHHLVIGLKRPMGRGETLAFRVVRVAIAGFTNDEEWLETTIDHPVERLARTIIFPPDRPCVRATVDFEGSQLPLDITKIGGGRTRVRFDIHRPRVDTPNTMRWIW